MSERSGLKTHKNLDVWKRSVELVVSIYTLTNGFPMEEKFALTSQLRRSAVSIPSNIAEGAARGSAKDFCKFLYISLGSLAELETQLIIAERLGFLKKDEIISEMETVRMLLLGLIRNVRGKQ